MISCIKRKLLQRRFDSGKLRDTDLVYASTARCCCGAGLAYITSCHLIKGADHAWDCSDILMKRTLEKEQEGHSRHSPLYEFAFWNIKSEKQPSANGLTTRGKMASPCEDCQSGKTVHYTHFEYMGKLATAHWDKGVKAEDGKAIKELSHVQV